MTHDELMKINEQIDDPENIADMLVIRKGTTNGDVITGILKSSKWARSTRNISLADEDSIFIEIGSNWWNSPYKSDIGGTK